MAMKHACEDCLNRFGDLDLEQQHSSTASRAALDRIDKDLVSQARRLSEDHQQNRETACREFWSKLKDTTSSLSIPRVHFEPGIASDEEQQVHNFIQKFHSRNLPCLVTGLEERHFAYVSQHWREKLSNEVNPRGTSKINRQWFLDALGEDCVVPLRYNEDSSSSNLDENGRADESKTRNVPMKEWVEILQSIDVENGTGRASGTVNGKQGDNLETVYYLKDWHLQQIRSQKEVQTKPQQLYSCPGIFQHDLLNPFLIKYTKGDFRFCYWGPANSSTLRHSDVMHSFSWSYNVHGTKEWTFFSPYDDSVTFSVLQKTGQAIFVPATWQHHVVNLEETISINHNWITASNLDLTWECLKTEIAAIRDELMKWQGENMEHDMEACENMLRGCVGLDVSSFFFMTLMRLTEVIASLLLLLEDHDADKNQTQQHMARLLEMSRLTDVLEKVMCFNQDLVQLGDRISVTMQSETFAFEAERMAKSLIEWVTSLISR